ncbi:DUF3566 domain-containing protein [Aeromicrobium flavum]|uniref:DUF3566 domain-containing protein n=1 Tax=Aeromicrobium flavum TaxID=416568 RepID=UPI001FEB099F|nr:DUF3566 domain-containing protein [Aeromicrobium flavum]
MSDQKPGEGQQNGSPPNNAKSNGTAPTVSARRPLSKAEYARTTQATPDTTAVIPAVRDDAKPPADDRPTQTFKAVPAEKPSGKPVEKKPAPQQKKADKPGKKPAPVVAAAPAPAPAPAAPAPATPKPEQKAAPATKTAPAAPKQVPASKAPATKAPASKAPAKAPAASTSGSTEAASTRSARLKLSHVEPWSVTKMAFVVSVALMVVSVVAVTVFWLVMQITGVWGALNDSVSNVLADDAAAFDVTDYLGFGRVVGLTLLVSSLNVIFMTALATIAAHLYNLAAGILGGIELTFGERK